MALRNKGTVKAAILAFFVVFSPGLASAEHDNITVELQFNPSEVIIDGTSTTTTTTATDFDNPFISSPQPLGLIGLSNTVQMRYVNDSRERIEITQNSREADFLVPFTQDGYSSLTDKENEIADNSFFNLRPPVFAFSQVEPSISVIYDFAFPVTDITGPVDDIETVIIRNRLDSDNETQFVLRTG